MLKQGSYDWAKEFLNSQAWSLLQQHFGNDNSFSFSLPHNRPSVVISDISCLSDVSTSSEQGSLVMDSGTDNLVSTVDDHSTPPSAAICKTPPKGKRGKKPPISEADLRRSDRIHNQNKGFKSSICKEKNCLGCSPNPPVLSPSVVRDLGATFYNIEASKLSDANLNAKSVKEVVTKPSHKMLKLAKESEDGPSKRLRTKVRRSRSPPRMHRTLIQKQVLLGVIRTDVFSRSFLVSF